MIHFNNKIKEARLEKNMTQKQLAEKLTDIGYKTSNTAIANWESGLNKPDIDTLYAICRILSKDGNYFFDTTNPNYMAEIEIDFGKQSTQLLNYYRKLNNLGKDKLVENAKDLAEIPKYTDKKTDEQDA